MPYSIRATGPPSLMPLATLPLLSACFRSLSTRLTASQLSKKIDDYGKMHMMLTKLPPELFRLLAHSARLQLPLQPLHTPWWRQAGCLTFHMHLSHVLRVSAAHVLGRD